MRKLLLIIPVLFFTINGFAQSVSTTTANGIVFHDVNGNGKKDRREQGIAGVAVSNGVEVVQTDENGRYQLPVGEDNIIFVIKPEGYMTPLNEQHLPQFFYIHKPEGSPDNLKFAGVAPTGKLPESIDFPLLKQEEAEDFSVLLFGDPQAYNLQEIEFFRKGIVQQVDNRNNAVFGISLGDLVGDDLDLHPPYINALAEVGLPFYNVIGNHDLNFDVTADSLSDETFESHFGPANYSFNYGNAHFIILDDVLYPHPLHGRGYWGGFRKDQLDFVENNLKFVPKDKLIVISFHIPLMHQNENSFRNADRQRLFDLLKDYPNTLSLSAHTHLQRHNFYGKADGWHQDQPHHEYNVGTTSGDWYSGEIDSLGVPVSTMRDGTPRGYAFLNITDNQYTLEYQVSGKPADHQINVFHPQVVARGRGTSAGIFANFFMGTPEDLVEYKVGEGEWIKMAPISAPDPTYVGSLYRWDLTDDLFPGRRPSAAVNSTHLWRGGIPTNLPVGEYTIEIRAKDMFGKTHYAKSLIRLEEAKPIQN